MKRKGFQLQIKRIWLKILSFYIETLSFCFFRVPPPSHPTRSQPQPSFNFHWKSIHFQLNSFHFQLNSFHFELNSLYLWQVFNSNPLIFNWYPFIFDSPSHILKHKKNSKGVPLDFSQFFGNISIMTSLNKFSENKLLESLSQKSLLKLLIFQKFQGGTLWFS